MNSKNLLVCIICLLLTANSFGQAVQSLPDRSFTTNIGLSKLGTGDMYGIMIAMEYQKQFRPRFSWSTELATTIHDGYDLLLVKLDNQPQQDMSYRYTIAGIQLAGKLGYHFVRSKSVDFGAKLGVLARYQSSSLSDSGEILFPSSTGYPLPARIIRNREPQRTIAAGAMLQLFAKYTFKKNVVVGATTGLQLDTNGDTMFPVLALSIGKRF